MANASEELQAFCDGLDVSLSQLKRDELKRAVSELRKVSLTSSEFLSSAKLVSDAIIRCLNPDVISECVMSDAYPRDVGVVADQDALSMANVRIEQRPSLKKYGSDRRSLLLHRFNSEGYFHSLLHEVAHEQGGGGTKMATSVPMRPNDLIGVREVTDEPMRGQCEAFARVALSEGTCMPFLGNVWKDDRDGKTNEREGYAVGLSGNCILSPSLRTASSVVNCAIGPDRSNANKKRNEGRVNARLLAIHDPSGFPHLFWKLMSAVGAGETIWGDYGDAYWEGYTAGADCERPRLCSILLRFQEPLRGLLCDLPVDLTSADPSPSSSTAGAMGVGEPEVKRRRANPQRGSSNRASHLLKTQLSEEVEAGYSHLRKIQPGGGGKGGNGEGSSGGALDNMIEVMYEDEWYLATPLEYADTRFRVQYQKDGACENINWLDVQTRCRKVTEANRKAFTEERAQEGAGETKDREADKPVEIDDDDDDDDGEDGDDGDEDGDTDDEVLAVVSPAAAAAAVGGTTTLQVKQEQHRRAHEHRTGEVSDEVKKLRKLRMQYQVRLIW